MDTQKITRELLGTGLTQQELADLVPCSQPTIAAYANGKRGSKPSFLVGSRLLVLHRERCPAELPRVDGKDDQGVNGPAEA